MLRRQCDDLRTLRERVWATTALIKMEKVEVQGNMATMRFSIRRLRHISTIS